MCGLPVMTIVLSTGEKVLVDGDYDGEWLSTHFIWRWNALAGRVQGMHRGKHRGASWLGRAASGCPPHLWVEYKNGDPLDNRSCNIRWVTPKQAMAKRWVTGGKSLSRSKITGYYGVTLTSDGYYQARYRGLYLGYFKDPRDAAQTYNNYVTHMGYDDPLNEIE